MIEFARTRRSTLVSIAVFAAAAALYFRTTGPTLGGGFDSEEFQQAAYTLSVAHSTGYPLYLILGKIATLVIPLGNVAYRVNLLSALVTAGSVALVYLNALELTKRHLSSLAAAAVYATNAAVWRQAGIASVGPLHLLLMAAILYALLRWQAGLKEKRGAPTAAALLFGLGLAHHRSVLALAPAIVIFALMVDRDILRRPRDIAQSAFWLAVPLLLYLYIPLRGAATPWYTNTLEGFVNEISGGDAGAFVRTAPAQLIEGISASSQYLHDSFGYLGSLLIIVGAFWQWRRRADRDVLARLFLLGLSTLLFFVWGTLYAGEPDRYLVLPVIFLVYWFAMGAGAVEDRLATRGGFPKTILWQRGGLVALTAAVTLVVALPFGDHFRIADWSTFDRVYKQWDEIFSLPIPQRSILVGNWGQLNAMRYMQRVENRRPDLEFVGTLYDPEPQTRAAQTGFAEGRTLYLGPGIPVPTGSFRYALLGPLLEVRDRPQMQASSSIAARSNAPSAAGVSLDGYGLSIALEPYEPSLEPTVDPNRTVRVSLDWRVESKVDDLIVRLQLADPEGRLITQKDESTVRGLYPPSQWVPGEHVADVHNLLIPAGTPPGTFTLRMGVLDKAQNAGWLASASIDVRRTTGLTRDLVFIQHPIDVALGDSVALAGYGGLDRSYKPGETIGFSLLWTVRSRISADLSVRFALVDSSGKAAQGWTLPPISYYPTFEWQAGELLKAYYDLSLSRTIVPGDYVLNAGIGQEAMHPVASVHIAP